MGKIHPRAAPRSFRLVYLTTTAPFGRVTSNHFAFATPAESGVRLELPWGLGHVETGVPEPAERTGTVGKRDDSSGAKKDLKARWALTVKPFPSRNLIVTGNALIRLNNAGLRSTVVPLVGVSYTF